MLNIKAKMPTWKELCELEPALLELEQLAHKCAEDTSPRNDAGDLRWYMEIKPRLVKLVGWERPVPGYTKQKLPLDEFGCIPAGLLIDRKGLTELKAACDAVPEKYRVLYDSPAYDVVYDYLLDVFEGE